MRKFISLILFTAFVSASAVDVCAVYFTDISGHWGEPYIEATADKGAIVGFPNGTFRPEVTISKGQFVSVVSNLYSLGSTVSPTGHWASDHFRKVRAMQAIPPAWNNQTSLDGPITREDAAYIFVTLGNFPSGDTGDTEGLNTFNDIEQAAEYARGAISVLSGNNVLTGMGNGMFEPKAVLTRAQVCVIITKIIEFQEGAIPDQNGSDDTPQAEAILGFIYAGINYV